MSKSYSIDRFTGEYKGKLKKSKGKIKQKHNNFEIEDIIVDDVPKGKKKLIFDDK
jgi:hypothetical protein